MTLPLHRPSPSLRSPPQDLSAMPAPSSPEIIYSRSVNPPRRAKRAAQSSNSLVDDANNWSDEEDVEGGSNYDGSDVESDRDPDFAPAKVAQQQPSGSTPIGDAPPEEPKKKRGRKPGVVPRSVRESLRRTNHSRIEKARRVKINDALTALRELVPKPPSADGAGAGPSTSAKGKAKDGKEPKEEKEFKLEVLVRTVSHLRELTERVRVLEEGGCSRCGSVGGTEMGMMMGNEPPRKRRRSSVEEAESQEPRSSSQHERGRSQVAVERGDLTMGGSLERDSSSSRPRLPSISSWLPHSANANANSPRPSSGIPTPTTHNSPFIHAIPSPYILPTSSYPPHAGPVLPSPRALAPLSSPHQLPSPPGSIRVHAGPAGVGAPPALSLPPAVGNTTGAGHQRRLLPKESLPEEQGSTSSPTSPQRRRKSDAIHPRPYPTPQDRGVGVHHHREEHDRERERGPHPSRARTQTRSPPSPLTSTLHSLAHSHLSSVSPANAFTYTTSPLFGPSPSLHTSTSHSSTHSSHSNSHPSHAPYHSNNAGTQSHPPSPAWTHEDESAASLLLQIKSPVDSRTRRDTLPRSLSLLPEAATPSSALPASTTGTMMEAVGTVAVPETPSSMLGLNATPRGERFPPATRR